VLIDTHCHIHESIFKLNADEALARAHEAGVEKVICVGTGIDSSERAIAFADTHDDVYASVGVHPHDTKDGWDLTGLALSNKVIAVGEIGLDYFYDNSPRDVQITALKAQIEFALARNLPIIFHVRDAFADFWPIFDSYPGIRGELHSFTDTQENLDKALKRGLSIGINGISTFTKDLSQQAVFAAIPLDRLLLETDAPFLTPAPFRGKVNEPAFVKNVAEHAAMAREISLQELEDATTANAHALFAF
jgi:TatD DNase family protein